MTEQADNKKLIEELRTVERESATGTHAANSPILRGSDLAGRAADALEAVAQPEYATPPENREEQNLDE